MVRIPLFVFVVVLRSSDRVWVGSIAAIDEYAMRTPATDETEPRLTLSRD